MYYEENKKKQNEEKRDNPSIVAPCICGLDENPELVVEIGRYTLKVTETSVSLVELQKMGGLAFHYFWYIVLQTTASNIHGLIQRICGKNKPNLCV